MRASARRLADFRSDTPGSDARFQKAIEEGYRPALDLDESNAKIRESLLLAEEGLKRMHVVDDRQSSPAAESRPPPRSPPVGPGAAGRGFGGLDFASLLSDPNMGSMMSQAMSNPQFMEMCASQDS